VLLVENEVLIFEVEGKLFRDVRSSSLGVWYSMSIVSQIVGYCFVLRVTL